MARLINTGTPYAFLSDPGVLSRVGEETAAILGKARVCLVTDETVDSLYGAQVFASLEKAGLCPEKIVFAPGEGTKSMTSVSLLLDFLAERNFTRTDGLVALGGGVIGDLCGFGASIYLRGIRYIQVPTTFLAAVDSSVGGKTGVNLGSGKNLAGTFWQPSLVLFDSATMDTLVEAAILDGLAETVKCGMIADGPLFRFLEETPWTGLPRGEVLHRFVDRCADGAIGVKQRMVEEDERDQGCRQLLNFGHTLGHAIELASRYMISHGHAVAMGMAAMARIASAKGWSEEDCLTPLVAVLQKFGFNLDIPFSVEVLADAVLRDKKRRGGRIDLVVPARIGVCRLQSVDVEEIPSLIEMGLSR